MTLPDMIPTEPLAQKLGDIGHLGSAVGHHVINAFTAIVSNVEMLRLRGLPPTPEELSQLIDDIVHVSLEASGVARRLIDFTRPLTTPHLTSIDLDALIRTFLDEKRLQLPTYVELRTEFQGGLVPIRAQAEHLLVMLDYLLTNAIESRAGRAVIVTFRTLTDQRGWVVLEVEDDGSGMSEAILKHAVEPFFSTKPSHAGVGLSIVNGIWRRQRGTMSIRSQPDEGTMIRLCIEASGSLPS